MLKIRQEQIEAFERAPEESFLQVLVEHLQKQHSHVVVRLPTGDQVLKEMPAELLRRLVRNGIARARHYGISWQSKLGAFVALMFEIAPNFDLHPSVRSVLGDASVPVDARVDRIVQQITEHDWEEAEQRYDINAWLMVPNDKDYQ